MRIDWMTGCNATGAALLSIFVSAGCTVGLGPDRGDPAQYALSAEVSYACGAWDPALPTDSLGLFDVFWGGSALKATSHQRRIITNAGGTIVHEFNLPLIRAIVPPQRVPELDANLVVGVTNVDSLSWFVMVRYDRTPTEDDQRLFESLGGVIAHVTSNIGVIMGTLPDSAIPKLRSRPEVELVEGDMILCGAVLGDLVRG